MKHILLLPRTHYWQWVAASQDYALQFDVNLTSDPNTAGRHFYPGQTVSLVAAEGAYPLQGDIVDWFQQHFPQAELDLIEVAKPEGLRILLAERVENEDRFGATSSRAQIFEVDWFADAPIQLAWPTDYPVVTQPFGVNPDIYAYWGLPGHEGLDIRAPMGSKIYACADGEVYDVHDRIDDSHPYGRHVRIRHAHGYRTVYAHLEKVLVSKNQQVKMREVIGKADSTGNSTGSHLHLTLKRDGASAGGYTHFPKDVLDPTPFLLFPGQERNAAAYPWPLARCLAGVNGRPDGSLPQLDLDVVAQSGVEAVKLSMHSSQADIGRLKQGNPSLFLMTRLHLDFGGRPMSASDWAAKVRRAAKRHYDAGVRYFEVHRAPNLYSEGCYLVWPSGAEFARWWIDAVNMIKMDLPEAKFGFPGLSIGDHVEGQRMDAEAFLQGADDGLLAADWLGAHSYWTAEADIDEEHAGAAYASLRRDYPEKMIFITEFGNVNALTNPAVKGREYAAFLDSLRQAPGIGAAFGQILSSTGPYRELAWRTEDGAITDVVRAVAERATVPA
jgi:murein DD-endopeptidase MepM/ murein hydrolase activator NlpD